ncbi:hypothetical protein MG293_011773 [Ovis ammon polii]|uniref:PDZ domain-containing protein n=1 Tax=Ovis ammon polii TaxID=230172 RepID=A0AAD4U741_OVIAM|nr:hypothetical protein MG293_011773 [Ovis ammon polii]
MAGAVESSLCSLASSGRPSPLPQAFILHPTDPTARISTNEQVGRFAVGSDLPGQAQDPHPERQALILGVFQGAAMATLYPSLEDLKVDQAMQAAVSGPSPGQVVAPVSGNSLGALRAEIKPGVREIHLCKDERGKTGLRLQAIDKGLFVQLVQANTPASLVGLRFGDQILQIDGRDCAGWSTDKAHQVVKKASAEKIVIVVRDRPFQRTITMHKDSTGHVGFVIKKGKIISLVKGSSAARNGLLTNHYVCEVNGQNVIGLKDKEVTEILATAGNVITLTIIPTVIYEHMVKNFRTPSPNLHSQPLIR